ncbi:MAG: metallophosphoesterase family protein [Terriglobales bacterium]
MRLLLLSDIHSNLEALEACLAAAPPTDKAVNLGDIVGYGANPNEVTERARAMAGIFVRGNHDKVVAGIDTVESFNPIAGVAAIWNREQLSSERLSWLHDLPKGPIAMDELGGVQYVHGAPDDEDRYVLTPEDAASQLIKPRAGITFFGHTHIQGAFQLHGDIVRSIHPAYETVAKQETWDLPLKEGLHYMINPGSIGQPRDGDWRAAFAIFDSVQQVVTFFRVPYELRSAQEKIFAAHLPARLATRLAAGR